MFWVPRVLGYQLSKIGPLFFKWRDSPAFNAAFKVCPFLCSSLMPCTPSYLFQKASCSISPIVRQALLLWQTLLCSCFHAGHHSSQRVYCTPCLILSIKSQNTVGLCGAIILSL
jgi:hypothetical protein